MQSVLIRACAMTTLVLNTVPVHAQAAPQHVEVLHWWSTGGGAAAVATYREALAKNGVEWKDIAVGGFDNARTLLRTRLLKGDPPTAAQITSDMAQFATDKDKLGNLDAIAIADKWDNVLPPAVQSYAKMGGAHYAAVPVDINRLSTLFVSGHALAKIGAGAPPTTWDELFAMGDKAKAAGILPYAWGNNQVISITFQGVAFSVMGPEIYRKAILERNDAALKAPELVKTFETFRRLAAYADKSALTRRWNEGTQSMIQGGTLFQIMGDWAKGEFLKAGQKPGVDFYCTATPGTAKSFQFSADSLIFFTPRKDNPAARATLARTLMDVKNQEAFNLVKGSIPARTDADMSKFDDCSKRSFADFAAASKSGALTPYPLMILPAGRNSAMNDVIIEFFNNGEMNASSAAEKLAHALKTN
jgi:glucose/mannose transport system substrate-binding protein